MTLTEAKTKAHALARELNAFNPVAATASPDGRTILIAFDVIPHPSLPWSRAVEVEAEHASYPVVVRLMDDWKQGVRNAIAINDPSPAVRKAIAVHGIRAVKKALGG